MFKSTTTASMRARRAPRTDLIDRALKELVELVEAEGVEFPDAHARVALAFHLTDDQAADLTAAYDAYTC